MSISNFETLLSAARQQVDPQRLLFVFLKASLPKDHAPVEAERFEQGQGGALEAVMTVDKPLDELTTFDDLVVESKQLNRAWQMVLIGCLPGLDGSMPSTEDAKLPLKVMVETVQNGGDVSRFMALDHQGNPVQFY